jgi:hypothetical protein
MTNYVIDGSVLALPDAPDKVKEYVNTINKICELYKNKLPKIVLVLKDISGLRKSNRCLDLNTKLQLPDGKYFPVRDLVRKFTGMLERGFDKDRPSYLELQVKDPKKGNTEIELDGEPQITPHVGPETAYTVCLLTWLNRSLACGEKGVFVIVTSGICDTYNVSSKINKIHNSSPFLDKTKFLVNINEKLANANISQINPCKIKFERLSDAVSGAKKDFSGYLEFGPGCQAGISRLRDAAGPPDWVYAYLKTMTNMVAYFRKHPEKLTTNAPIEYLSVCGIDCSDETDAALQDRQNLGVRTWHDMNGRPILFRFHLKPATFRKEDDTGPRYRTVRIYFQYLAGDDKALVGNIGPHPPDYTK